MCFVNINRDKLESEGKSGLIVRFFNMQSLLLLLLLSVFLMLFQGEGFCEERLSVKSKLANVRSGPGIDNDVIWQVERYHPLIIQEKKSGWMKFKDFEDDVAWIHASLVDKTESVISIKDNCNVRKGPGTKHPVLFTVERGVPFKVLAKQDKWLNIEHADGDKGWIYNALVW